MESLKTKICSTCKLNLPLDSFGNLANGISGKMYECKQCVKNRNSRYRFENKEKRKQKQVKNRELCGEEIRAQERRNYYKHRRQRIDYQKEYAQRPENKGRIAANKAKLEKEKYWSDNQFRLAFILRRRMGAAIRGKQKVGSAVDDLGCSIPEFEKGVESRFWPGMTWEKRGNGPGKWNLDHIIPLSKFDLEDRKQYLLAAHYSNYQPLWWEDNQCKAGSIPTVLAQPVAFCGMMLAVALDENNQAVVRCFK